MSDPAAVDPPPRVEIRLPDGRTIPGWLIAWVQSDDGTWHGQALVNIPAAAIREVPGEDYTAVPREPAARTPVTPGYVLTADTRPGQPRTAVLHKASCWLLDDAATWIRVTPVEDAAQARGALRFPDTGACDICNPMP